MNKAAGDAVTAYMKSVEELGQQEGLFTIIDLQHDLPTEWHKAMQATDTDSNHVLTIPDLEQFLPFYALTYVQKPNKFEIANTDFFCSSEMTGVSFKKSVGLKNKEIKFKPTFRTPH